MGWKIVREQYGIDHIVTAHGDGVALSAPYGGRVMTVTADGKIFFETSYRGGGIDRIAREITDDPETFRLALSAEDRFERSIPVYTWEGGVIIERLCEETGWPNVTHDGHLMHENTHSPDRAAAAAMAMSDARARVESRRDRFEDARRTLARLETELADAVEAVAMLETDASSRA